MKIRKNHCYDGTNNAGKPSGPVLEVLREEEHKPVDGPSYSTIYFLSDGTWSFSHNVTVIKGD